MKIKLKSYILIGTQPQLNKINISHLNIGQTSVLVGNSAVRNLGSWFDSNLNIITHIKKAIYLTLGKSVNTFLLAGQNCLYSQ